MNSNLLINIIEDILNYSVSKTIFDNESKKRVEIYNKVKADFFKESQKNNNITKELAITKLKLELLKKRTDNISDNYKALINNLINELEDHILSLRKKRLK